MTAITSRISKRTVDACVLPATGEALLWDCDLKGFFVRVYPTGRRVYGVKYRHGSVQRKFTIGVHGSPWTPETARKRAQEALDSVRQGEDPAAEKKATREALTVAALIDRYLEEGPATKPSKRESTWAIDASNLNSHIRPLLGRKIANVLTKADAARAIRDIGAGKTATASAPAARRVAGSLLRVVKAPPAEPVQPSPPCSPGGWSMGLSRGPTPSRR